MSNTSTTIAFLQKSPESAERIASLAGTKTTTKRTRQVAEDGFIFKDRQYTGVESEREVEEFVIHPNTIKRLMRGECVIIGKYPKSWHARVTVSPKATADEKLGSDFMKLLQGTKQATESSTPGRVALDLSNRAREFVDSGRRRNPGPGLRTEERLPPGQTSETTHQETDDRF